MDYEIAGDEVYFYDEEGRIVEIVSIEELVELYINIKLNQ